MSPGPRPAEVPVLSLRVLYEKSGGERYGLTLQAFGVVLEQVAVKYVPQATQQQKLEFWRDLKLEELAPARDRAGRPFSRAFVKSSMTLPAASPRKTPARATWLTLSTPIFMGPPNAMAAAFPG